MPQHACSKAVLMGDPGFNCSGRVIFALSFILCRVTLLKRWRERNIPTTYKALAECFNIHQEQNLSTIHKICSIITSLTSRSCSENVKKWTAEMVNDFNDLVEYTKTSFHDQIESQLHVLVKSVLSLHILSPDQSEELEKIKTVEEVFCTLSPHWSFVNYDLLASLIEKHGTEENCRKLAKYVKEFEQFSECKVSDIPDDEFTTANGNSALVVKLEHENKELRVQLKEIIKLKRTLAEFLEVDTSVLQLKSVEGRMLN